MSLLHNRHVENHSGGAWQLPTLSIRPVVTILLLGSTRTNCAWRPIWPVVTPHRTTKFAILPTIRKRAKIWLAYTGTQTSGSAVITGSSREQGNPHTANRIWPVRLFQMYTPARAARVMAGSLRPAGSLNTGIRRTDPRERAGCGLNGNGPTSRK